MGDYQFPNNKPSRLRRQKRRDKRLHEEVIECRRHGGGDSNKKWRVKSRVKRLQKERLSGDMPLRVSIGEKHKVTSFDDNLEPLQRFLQQNVGRHWDDVYSELNQQLDRSTVTGLHVFQHLEWFIESRRYERFDPEYYTSRKTGVGRWFRVHPETGILLTVKNGDDHKGPYPKKARFKKEKEREKARRKSAKSALRRPLKKTQNHSNYGDSLSFDFALVKAMFWDILSNKIKFGKTDKSVSPCWYKLEESPFVLKKNGGSDEYTFSFNKPQFGFYQPLRQGEATFPIVFLRFYVSLSRPEFRSNSRGRFECTWRLSDEKGWPTTLISFER